MRDVRCNLYRLTPCWGRDAVRADFGDGLGQQWPWALTASAHKTVQSTFISRMLGRRPNLNIGQGSPRHFLSLSAFPRRASVVLVSSRLPGRPWPTLPKKQTERAHRILPAKARRPKSAISGSTRCKVSRARGLGRSCATCAVSLCVSRPSAAPRSTTHSQEVAEL